LSGEKYLTLQAMELRTNRLFSVSAKSGTFHPETLGFFSTCLPLTLLDCGVQTEGLGIVMDKKLLNTL